MYFLLPLTNVFFSFVKMSHRSNRVSDPTCLHSDMPGRAEVPDPPLPGVHRPHPTVPQRAIRPKTHPGGPAGPPMAASPTTSHTIQAAASTAIRKCSCSSNGSSCSSCTTYSSCLQAAATASSCCTSASATSPRGNPATTLLPSVSPHTRGPGSSNSCSSWRPPHPKETVHRQQWSP